MLILKYCIENSYLTGRRLVVISLDYSEAFDSIDKEKMIEGLMKYKIHPHIIDTIVRVYDGDQTKLILNEETEALLKISSGIKQRCSLLAQQRCLK